MCFLSMKMLGTDRWLVISWRAFWMSAPSSEKYVNINFDELARVRIRTDLVEFNDVWLDAHLAQQRLGGLAVWAVGLGEDRYK